MRDLRCSVVGFLRRGGYCRVQDTPLSWVKYASEVHRLYQTHVSSYWKPLAAKVPLYSENDLLEKIIHSDAKLNKSSP